MCRRLKTSNTMTRLAVGRTTPAVSPQSGTKSDLRRSEIKNFPGGACPLARTLHTLYAISHMHTGTPLFKILDPPLKVAESQAVYDEEGDYIHVWRIHNLIVRVQVGCIHVHVSTCTNVRMQSKCRELECIREREKVEEGARGEREREKEGGKERRREGEWVGDSSLIQSELSMNGTGS